MELAAAADNCLLAVGVHDADKKGLGQLASVTPASARRRRHLDPVELFFQSMEGVIADLVGIAHLADRSDARPPARAGELRCAGPARWARPRLPLPSLFAAAGAASSSVVYSSRTICASRDSSPSSAFSTAFSARSCPRSTSFPTGSSSRSSSSFSSGLSVRPWITSVPITTQNAVSTIRSRYGKHAPGARSWRRRSAARAPPRASRRRACRTTTRAARRARSAAASGAAD